MKNKVILQTLTGTKSITFVKKWLEWIQETAIICNPVWLSMYTIKYKRENKRERKKSYPKKEMLMDKAYNLWDQSMEQTKGSFCKE